MMKHHHVSWLPLMAVAFVCIVCFFLSPLLSPPEDEVAHLYRSLAQGDGDSLGRFLSVDTVGNRAVIKMLPFGGRLGDQMFMYASTLAVALREEMHPCMVKFNQHRSALPKMFVGPFEFCEKGDHDTKWNGGGGSGGPTNLDFTREENDSRTVGLFGFMHWPVNFMEIKDRVFETFALLPEIQTKAEERLESYGDAVRVGVHIRRGDKTYMTYKWNAQYYEHAFDYMRNKYARNGKKIVFIIATDGKDWVKGSKILKEADVNLLEGTSYQEDMAILINCDHSILSGGGFGFWAAFLGPWQNGGEVLMNKNQEPSSRLEEWTFLEDVVKQHDASITKVKKL